VKPHERDTFVTPDTRVPPDESDTFVTPDTRVPPDESDTFVTPDTRVKPDEMTPEKPQKIKKTLKLKKKTTNPIFF
jgi:hypothetical protein